MARDWNVLVAEGRQASEEVSGNQWQLGDLAVEVVGPAGESAGGEGRAGRLRQYADEIGEAYSLMADYRWVATRWEQKYRTYRISFSLYRQLAAEPDRVKILGDYIDKAKEKGKRPSFRGLQEFRGVQPNSPWATEKAPSPTRAAQLLIASMTPRELAQVDAALNRNPDVAEAIEAREAAAEARRARAELKRQEAAEREAATEARRQRRRKPLPAEEDETQEPEPEDEDEDETREPEDEESWRSHFQLTNRLDSVSRGIQTCLRRTRDDLDDPAEYPNRAECLDKLQVIVDIAKAIEGLLKGETANWDEELIRLLDPDDKEEAS